MNNKTLPIILIVILVAVGFFLFRNKTAAPVVGTDTNMMDTGTTVTTPSSSTSSSTDTSTANTIKNITVNGSSFKFYPSTITVKKGDTVKITFVNTGGMHDWRVDEFNAATKVIQGGATDTVTFVADKAGTFEYYCSVGTHRQMGMRGSLIVTE